MQDSAGQYVAGTHVGARRWSPVPGPLRQAMFGAAIAIFAVIAVEQLDLSMRYWLTWKFFAEQDVPVMIVVALALCLVALVGVPSIVAATCERAVVSTPVTRAAVVAAAGLAVVIGTHVAALDFPYSRDEIMALFDAAIIADGRLLAPVPPEWRPYVPALQPVFRLPVPDHAAWASTYLPGNAAIRAVLGLVFDRAFVNAALLVVALVALLAIARRLWPERPDAWLLALVLAATSSQALFMSMTPYAMSAHLALNLVWLWLFQRNTALSHAAAIAVGFLGTGLHQLVFHPLFVAPFLFQLLLDRRIGLALVYAVAYAAIGLFWIVYWQLLLSGTGAAPEAASAMGISYFLTRVTQLFANVFPSAYETMVQNLFRFAAWQNPLLVVLIGPGLISAWRAGGDLRALAVGVVATPLAMLVLLPYQDIGWGYRYIHGLLGSAVLVATLGWIGIVDRLSAEGRRAAYGVAALATLGAVLILVPLHGSMMRAMIEPYSRAFQSIRAKPADVVVIETIAIHYGDDLVRNDPRIADRPVTLDIGELNEDLVRRLCRRYDVALFRGREAIALGVPPAPDPTKHHDYPRLAQLMGLIEGPECRSLKGVGAAAP